MDHPPIVSLTELATQELDKAHHAEHGKRSAVTVYGGKEHGLRQTVIALVEGHSLAEHESPGEATLQVLQGRVRFVAGEKKTELSDGDLYVIPPERHSVDALTDAVILLTVALHR